MISFGMSILLCDSVIFHLSEIIIVGEVQWLNFRVHNE